MNILTIVINEVGDGNAEEGRVKTCVKASDTLTLNNALGGIEGR